MPATIREAAQGIERPANSASPTTSNAEDEVIGHIRSAERILMILGAGLSQPSGLPTFRQHPEFWGRPISEVATSSAFNADPVAVWSVYERMRQISRVATPNLGHIAISDLTRAKPGCLTISQNIDDLCEKAGHNRDQLISLHGSLFDVRCSNDLCELTGLNTSPAPTVPGMDIHPWDARETNISLPHVSRSDVPLCPRCHLGLLRPGVVWFHENLPSEGLRKIDRWLANASHVDLVLVIGTERTPFLGDAQRKGAKVVYFNKLEETTALENIGDARSDSSLDSDSSEPGEEWVILGDASETLPYIIGKALNKNISGGRV